MSAHETGPDEEDPTFQGAIRDDEGRIIGRRLTTDEQRGFEAQHAKRRRLDQALRAPATELAKVHQRIDQMLTLQTGLSSKQPRKGGAKEAHARECIRELYGPSGVPRQVSPKTVHGRITAECGFEGDVTTVRRALDRRR